MAGYFELKTAKDGQTYWNLKAGNHEIILTSEMYTTRAAAENGIESSCDNGIASVTKNGTSTEIKDKTEGAAAA